jgi:hypothetical protein
LVFSFLFFDHLRVFCSIIALALPFYLPSFLPHKQSEAGASSDLAPSTEQLKKKQKKAPPKRNTV